MIGMRLVLREELSTMPLLTNGVLKGKVADTQEVDSRDKTQHYEVHIRANHKDYRIAINVGKTEL
jgi:hypothetical protein